MPKPQDKLEDAMQSLLKSVNAGAWTVLADRLRQIVAMLCNGYAGRDPVTPLACALITTIIPASGREVKEKVVRLCALSAVSPQLLNVLLVLSDNEDITIAEKATNVLTRLQFNASDPAIAQILEFHAQRNDRGAQLAKELLALSQ